MSVQEKQPTTAETIFTLEYGLRHYELDSARGLNSPDDSYEKNARDLAEIGQIKDGDVILDLGCGTANSTIVLAESNPHFRSLYAVDQSIGFLGIAGYKFGIGPLEIPATVEIDIEVMKFIQGQRERARKFWDRTFMIVARAESLPLPDQLVDKTFSCQVIHWFAALDSQAASTPSHLKQALTNVSRVLVQGGSYFFDSTISMIDFGDLKIEGRPLNDYHHSHHPFNLAYHKHLRAVLSEKGLPGVNRLNETPRGKQYFLHIKTLEDTLTKVGLELIPLSSAGKFKLFFSPRSMEQIADNIVADARMNTISSEIVATLPEEEKERVFIEALERTRQENYKIWNLEEGYYEVVPVFAAKKVKCNI